MSKPDPRIDAARRMASHFADLLQADLSLRLWTGEVLPLGPNARDDIQVVVARPDVIRRLILKPGLMMLFELIATGELRVEGGSPLEAVDRWDYGKAMNLAKRLDKGLMLRLAVPFLLKRGDGEATQPPAWDASGVDGVGHARKQRRDKDFISFHYDVSNDFYRLFLGETMAYSSGWHPSPDATLDEAQGAKFDRICRKLRLKPGLKLLDIGSGWGGLSCWAAARYGVHVHGVTLSQAQLDWARARAEAMGVADRVTFELRDYREIAGSGLYHAVAQVEMFEHVGFANHEAHFRHMHRLLKPGGLYFHQATVRRGDADGAARPNATTKVITRFIFPGGELDTIGMTVNNLGRYGFEVMDVENMRAHYDLTIREWAKRLWDNREEAYGLVGEARTRLWALYFALFAKGFERGVSLNYQTVAQRRRSGRSRLPLNPRSEYDR
ncbi:cyclopropane-fatty-acyl-phospholipid synthase [Brevundimonas sp. Leaf363]|uniref:SAM-dependent methyltransferase n=1 Tax=Brevundimonas sp. Leaf363 TaxID=1736353 RepID=UPI0006FD8931|nr:cyclopropane-fatty-acyl-phospholipid synthase family protein [Brevundimonas sp. Leaf363]KQS55112.1 cyclopropane-fatty-acyl-phospholipid synthase [Brevundimonas sp. Leaf363]